MEILFYILAVLLLIVVLLQLVQLRRRPVDWSPLAAKLEALLDAQERTDRSLRDEMGRARSEARASSQEERTELARTLASFSDSVQARLADSAKIQNDQLESFSRQLGLLTAANEKKLEDIRGIIDEKLKQIQEDNARQLDRMRQTVDEKLQGTLEARLGESFRQVSERLEQHGW